MSEISIQISPISINKCWQGKRFKTPEYKAWREMISWGFYKYKIEGVEWCEVELNFYIKNYNMADVDNLIKPTLDALTEAGVIKDDRYVKSVKATKHKSNNERIDIKITSLT